MQQQPNMMQNNLSQPPTAAPLTNQMMSTQRWNEISNLQNVTNFKQKKFHENKWNSGFKNIGLILF